MNNAELIKALRYCKDNPECYSEKAAQCPYDHKWTNSEDCQDLLLADAADALEAAEQRIAELEAQMPKEGEWNDYERGRWVYAQCNLCGKVQDVRSNYCPNCGARMANEQKRNEEILFGGIENV